MELFLHNLEVLINDMNDQTTYMNACDCTTEDGYETYVYHRTALNEVYFEAIGMTQACLLLTNTNYTVMKVNGIYEIIKR